MDKKLPIYKMIINDEDATGVDFIALVDRPAIEVNWHKFSDKQRFKTIDAEKRIVSGALMVADMLIYRFDAERGEYYCTFDKETIYSIVKKYFKQGFTSNVNAMHESTKQLSDIYLIESFLIDTDRGINTPNGFDTLPNGSWFGSFKVDNEQVWDEYITTGIFKGFSVEGMFNMELDTDNLAHEMTELAKVIQNYSINI